MECNTKSLKVEQLSLEEGPMRYGVKNEHFVKNETKRDEQRKDSIRLIKRIVYCVLIFLIVCIAFIVLVEEPYHSYAPSKCFRSAFVKLPIPTDNIKDDGPSVNSNNIPWKYKQWLTARDAELKSVLSSQAYTNPLTNSNDESVENNTSSISSFNEIDDTDINKILLVWLDILKMSKTSTSDEEFLEESDTSSIPPGFGATETFQKNFSNIDSVQESWDPYLTRFWQALSNPDVWGPDNESSNEIGDATDKYAPASNLARRRFAEIVSETSDNDVKFSDDAMTRSEKMENRTGDLVQSLQSLSSNDETLKNALNARDDRNGSEKLNLAVDILRRKWKATHERLDRLAAQVVIGNTSDTMIVKLRKRFVEMVRQLAWRVPLIPSNGSSWGNYSVNLTTENWYICMQKLKWKINELIDEVHQQKIEGKDVSTQQMANELCSIVECLNREYLAFVKIAIKLVLVRKPSINEKAIELEYVKCAKNLNTTIERLNVLTVKVIGGEFKDPRVIKIRRKFVKTVTSLAWRVGLIYSHMSDRDRNTFTLELKRGIATYAGSELQQWFEARDTAMRTVITEFQDIVEHFLQDCISCDSILTIYTYVMKFKEDRLEALYQNIDSVKRPEHTDNSAANCDMLDRALLDERRARLEESKLRELTQNQKTYWDRIQSAWNATSPSEIPMDVPMEVPMDARLDFMMVLTMMKHMVANASLELREEGHELLHDLFLEEQMQMQNQTDKWMSWTYALGNFTDNIPSTKITPALALNAFLVLGDSFNLNYQKIETEISKNDSSKFLFGKFVYHGKNPEKLYVRRVRNILNAIVRLYLKIKNPSVLRIMCNDSKMENVMKTTESTVSNGIAKVSKKHPIYWYPASTLKPPTSKRKRSSIWKSGNSMDDPNLITSKQFESSLEVFFEKMEIFASHIDRLHERYMTLNELNDDYLSREFSVESALSDDDSIV